MSVNSMGSKWSDVTNSVFSSISSISKHPLVMIVLIGIVIRSIIGIFATYTYDIYHWGVIIENIHTGNGLYGLDGYYYTQPWGYILGAISYVGELFGIGDLGIRVTEALAVEEYGWHFTATLATIPFIILMKVPLFLCDIAVAYVIRWIVMERTNDQKKGNIAFALWFLCPLTIVVSGVSVMFDNLTVLMLLLCIVFLMKDRCLLAGMMFSLSVLTKFFPVFLIFVLVSYILIKHRETGLAVRRSLEAVIGALLMLGIVMMPQLLDGDISSAFYFLTSRISSGMGSGFGAIESYGTIISYVAFLLISILLAIGMYRSKAEDKERTFMFVLMMNLIVLFLYPSAPQYLLLLLPFVIYHMTVHNWNLVVPGTILIIGSTLFALASNFTLLLSASEFMGVVSMDSLMGMIETFQNPVLGLSPMQWMYYSGAVLQYAGTIMLLLHLYLQNRSKFQSFFVNIRSSKDMNKESF